MNQSIYLKDVPDYYRRYIDLIPDGSYKDLMHLDLEKTKKAFMSLQNKPNYAYQSGKWTVLQVLSHLIDVERVMVHRIHAFSRNESGSIPGFDHDDYVVQADLSNKTIDSLLKEFELIRFGTIHLVSNLSDNELKRKGIANNVEFTTSVLSWIILGHSIHHVNILNERYVD
tara:strand:- start:729 stop:1241 length:513 start_codon:yes stop_codon:yes gene_type:complete